MRPPLLLALALSSVLAAPVFAGSDDAGTLAKKWKDHMGDIPFIVGREAGSKEAEFTGKPILYFYTADG